ncbi:nuclear transport factor 2 family protein [Novosphingobium sp. PASSN1]|uniref:nuclear transport factor 2 family protein n=1 Tax=Novosphingobium sp. PASSN1 TaxID=2015561 RepID=UPI0025FAD05C|nr:nuclear transport factor 2 family protein [Novosphingobium sp. PASSN1]
MEDLANVYAIERLVLAYATAANRRDFRAMADTFDDNGRLVGMAEMMGLNQEAIVGRADIFSFFSAALEAVEYIFQNAQLGPVMIDGDEATAQVMLTELARWRGQNLSVFLGRYEDRYIRTPSGWRFAERKLVPTTLFQPSGQFLI